MKNIKGVFLLLLFFCCLTDCGKFFNEGNSSEFNINQEITGMSNERVRIHKKKKQTKYREQDEKKVNVYLKKLSEAGSDREIIYIDETGFDEYYYREYSWSKRGNVY